MNEKAGLLRLAPVLLAALLIVSCGKPASEAGQAPDEAPPQKAAAGNGGLPFELVSIERVDSQRSNSAAGNTVYWEKEGPDSGVMIVLKLKTPELLEYYSSDFSLGYVDEAGIPRSACVGISSGVATPDLVKLSTWMLAGSMSRSWARPEKPYFGLLFGVPRKVERVTLYYAAPLMRDLELAAAGAKGEDS
ncbi:MAG: hypothetical protein JXO51_05300 [Candidatus Aminicenantes bacterium]|nr:hypothetical protein [Candidatus Aminicenantes bacterium]